MKPKTGKPLPAAEVVVFLKTSEKAQCSPEICKWTYTDTLPEITKMTQEFDPDTSTWLVKLTGTKLRDTATTGTVSDLQINGKS